MIAATVIAFDGLLAMSAGATISLGLLGRTYDTGVGFDLLVAKNLVYFFGHTIANLAHLPRRGHGLRAAAPLRGPRLRGDEGRSSSAGASRSS